MQTCVVPDRMLTQFIKFSADIFLVDIPVMARRAICFLTGIIQELPVAAGAVRTMAILAAVFCDGLPGRMRPRVRRGIVPRSCRCPVRRIQPAGQAMALS